ncbi:MAG: sigma-70 family RNA polymerase sigma factor [bacterium]|nr:sigma-70 family RNA polymerase sigma factor [bacterium]
MPPPIDHRQDLEFVHAVLAGDPEAGTEFAVRMRCVSRMLAARNHRLGRPLNDEELADLAQDVLLTVWRKLADYEGRAALESWVYRSCSFEFLNRLRKKRDAPATRDVTEEGTEPIEPEPPADEGLDLLLRHLASREAEVVRLRHVDELAFPEIAAALGISASSAKTHYYRAIDKLRDVLRERV